MSFYRDLDQLLSECPQAREYFASLPPFVQRGVRAHAQGIASLSGLQSCASDLDRGGQP